MRLKRDIDSQTDNPERLQGYLHDTRGRPAPADSGMTPRLLDLEQAAAYLGLSRWTVRELEAKRVLPRVRVPLPGGGELRKVLFDRADLDRLIEGWKDVAE
jgi:excisionase family DNA binding protein